MLIWSADWGLLEIGLVVRAIDIVSGLVRFVSTGFCSFGSGTYTTPSLREVIHGWVGDEVLGMLRMMRLIWELVEVV